MSEITIERDDKGYLSAIYDDEWFYPSNLKNLRKWKGGVYYHKRTKIWCVDINCKEIGERYYRSFETKIEAENHLIEINYRYGIKVRNRYRYYEPTVLQVEVENGDFLCDAQFLPLVEQYTWSLREGYIASGCGGRLKFHREVMKLAGYDIEDKEIDHINRERNDNRLSNLRLADDRTQNINQGLRSDNTTGIKGVSRKKNGYSASWYDGQLCQKFFSIKKYGEDRAKELAIAYRRIKENELDHYRTALNPE